MCVLTKDDGLLRGMIKDIFQQMKDEFLHSVTNIIEILKGRLFERDQENERLNKEINSLQTDLTTHKAEVMKQSKTGEMSLTLVAKAQTVKV